MQEKKVKKIQKLGFDVSETGKNGERFVAMHTVPEKELVLKMLKILSFEDEIFFWDYYHVTVTDPGGYVSAYMIGGNRAVYVEGNHGWSSEFAAISINELADMIIKNWDKDCDGGTFLNKVRISPHYNSQRDIKNSILS